MATIQLDRDFTAAPLACGAASVRRTGVARVSHDSRVAVVTAE